MGVGKGGGQLQSTHTIEIHNMDLSMFDVVSQVRDAYSAVCDFKLCLSHSVLSIYLSIYPSIRLSIYLPTYPSSTDR